MALAYLDDTNPISAATSVTPGAVGATLQQGDHAFICVTYKTSLATLATPAGWELIATTAVGTGAEADGSGPIQLRVYYKQAGAAGALTLPTFTLGGTTTGSVIQAGLIVYRGDAGAASTLNYTYTVGNDTDATSVTWSVTGASDIDINDDDVLLCFGAMTTNTTDTNFVVGGTPALTASGVTFGSTSNPWSTASGTGNNVRSFAFRAVASSGASNAAPSLAAVHETTGTTGGALFLRLMEVETRRFYFANSPSPSTFTNPATFWNDKTIGQANPHHLSETSSGSATSTAVVSPGNTNPWWVLLGQWVSYPASTSGVITGGTVTGVFALAVAWLESNAAANLHPVVVVRILGGATLISSAAASIEFPTTASGIQYSTTDTDPGTVAFTEGQQIMVELGYQATNTDGTDYTGTVYYGGTGSPDMANGVTTLSRPGWIDLQITPGVEFLPSVDGTATANLGFSAAAASIRNRPGIATASFGFTSTIAGDVWTTIEGVASANFGFSTSVHSVRETFGEVSTTFGFSADASGVRERFGIISTTFGFSASVVVDTVVAPPPLPPRAPIFAVSLVARVPSDAGSPTLVEVDRLVFDSMTYIDELNRPGNASLGCPIRSLSDAAKERLANLAQFPSEVWIYKDSDIVWAGEIQTLAVQGQSLQINCAGLLGYTWRMGITENLEFTQVDQFTVAKDLVDHWQELSYGNYGIDTSTVGVSGILRDRSYARDELHNIGQRLKELGEVIAGFDMHVDPSTRKLVLSYPYRGVDLTASVFFDYRNIDSAAVALSVGPDDLASDGSYTGGTECGSYVTSENADVRANYGRSWTSENFSSVTVGETMEGHGDAHLAARNDVFFQPGVTIIPRIGANIGDFEPGDAVSYSYDAGLGLQSGAYRVTKITVDVGNNGDQRIGVEFA